MRVFFSLCTLIVSLLVMAGVSAARQAPVEGASFRLVQIVYEDAAVSVDGEPVLDSLPYPLTSDYFPLTAGAHTITVAPPGAEADAGVSAVLDALDQHRYTVATIGPSLTSAESLLVIDETADVSGAPDENNSYAMIIHNVALAPAIDVYFNDQIVGDNVAFGGYTLAAFPAGSIHSVATMAESADIKLFESNYLIIPNSMGTATLSGGFELFTSGERFPYERFSLRTTDQKMGDFLSAYASLDGNNLSTFIAALDQAGMLDALGDDNGDYTIFAPSNAAFDALPDGALEALLADSQALERVLAYHIVPGYWPSFTLVGSNTLTSRQGGPLASEFTPAGSFKLNDMANVGLENRTANGVLYLLDTVLLPPDGQ